MKIDITARAAYFASGVIFVAFWALVAALSNPILMPSPWMTAIAAWDLLQTGVLAESMLASYLRIFAGWTIGAIVGIVFGLIMGQLPAVRALLGPIFQFARFIPPISFVTLFIIWLGVGEASRVLLIIYTTLFLVAINVASGVVAIDKGYLRAAKSMGASELQIFLYVIVPGSVPFMVTGVRIAMGNSFMTIVAAEILSAQSGIGYLIWDSQIFMQTANVFVGFVALCIMGFTTDRLVQIAATRFLYKYDVV